MKNALFALMAAAVTLFATTATAATTVADSGGCPFCR